MERIKRLTFKKVLRKTKWFVKKNVVMFVALIAAAITCIFVPFDREYLSYFDTRTLACLFITLAVVCALRNIKFFTILARRLVLLTGNLRTLFMMLISITFIGSMLIANDMALITFLPLGYFALSVTRKEKYMAYLFILQNISANLGGMLTPFGNPQNLYLYSFFNIDTLEFCKIMLMPFLLAIALLFLCCMLVKNKKLTIKEKFPEKLSVKRTVVYLVLFALSLLVVFRVVPVLIGLALILVSLLVLDRDALKMVDYPLL
ncbi:MAG: citrate transporter, partial [Ruminococcus sp.]|nr:citrate transporter [Ruminococcus sp.]